MPFPALLKLCLLMGLLLIVSVIDIRKRVIPDWLCLCAAATGLIGFHPANLLGLFAAAPLLAGAALKDGVGGGDIKLMAAIGLVLGLLKGLMALTAGLFAVLLYHAVTAGVCRLRNQEAPSAYPLAPFLTVGCIAAQFIV